MDLVVFEDIIKEFGICGSKKQEEAKDSFLRQSAEIHTNQYVYWSMEYLLRQQTSIAGGVLLSRLIHPTTKLMLYAINPKTLNNHYFRLLEHCVMESQKSAPSQIKLKILAFLAARVANNSNLRELLATTQRLYKQHPVWILFVSELAYYCTPSENIDEGSLQVMEKVTVELLDEMAAHLREINAVEYLMDCLTNLTELFRLRNRHKTQYWVRMVGIAIKAVANNTVQWRQKALDCYEKILLQATREPHLIFQLLYEDQVKGLLTKSVLAINFIGHLYQKCDPSLQASLAKFNENIYLALQSNIQIQIKHDLQMASIETIKIQVKQFPGFLMSQLLMKSIKKFDAKTEYRLIFEGMLSILDMNYDEEYNQRLRNHIGKLVRMHRMNAKVECQTKEIFINALTQIAGKNFQLPTECSLEMLQYTIGVLDQYCKDTNQSVQMIVAEAVRFLQQITDNFRVKCQLQPRQLLVFFQLCVRYICNCDKQRSSLLTKSKLGDLACVLVKKIPRSQCFFLCSRTISSIPSVQNFSNDELTVWCQIVFCLVDRINQFDDFTGENERQEVPMQIFKNRRKFQEQKRLWRLSKWCIQCYEKSKNKQFGRILMRTFKSNRHLMNDKQYQTDFEFVYRFAAEYQQQVLDLVVVQLSRGDNSKVVRFLENFVDLIDKSEIKIVIQYFHAIITSLTQYENTVPGCIALKVLTAINNYLAISRFKTITNRIELDYMYYASLNATAAIVFRAPQDQQIRKCTDNIINKFQRYYSISSVEIDDFHLIKALIRLHTIIITKWGSSQIQYSRLKQLLTVLQTSQCLEAIQLRSFIRSQIVGITKHRR